MSDTCITPVGRFVSGSITEKRTTDYEGRTLPEEKQHYAFGVADRKSTRLNSSHQIISYAVFCLKKKRYRHPALRLSQVVAEASGHVP